MLQPEMRNSIARVLSAWFILQLVPQLTLAKDLGWQPQKTWVFVVGMLSWKHSETYGSFPVKNRRDNAFVEFFKQNGVPDSQIVYLQDKQATQERIEMLKRFDADLQALLTSA